jgi:Holliday junction resolvase RusA-like endonuclease
MRSGLDWKETLQWIKKLSMQFYGWDRRYDLSNLFKAVEDAMVKAGIMRDDNLTVIQHIESAWEKAPTKEAQYIDIFLEV